MSAEVFLIISPGKESLPEKLPHTSTLSLSPLPYLLAGVPLGKVNKGIGLKKANCAKSESRNLKTDISKITVLHYKNPLFFPQAILCSLTYLNTEPLLLWAE